MWKEKRRVGEKRSGVMRMERSKKWREERGEQARGYRRRGKRAEKRENMKVDLGWKQQIKTPFDYSICANHKAQGFLYIPSTFDWIRAAMH